MTPLTIVMYHYVRPLGRSAFPAIKGLDLALFDQQLDYLARHYNPVSMEAVIDALDGRGELPPQAVLLTFDDGYLDHYTYVFPRLAARGLTGAFFPPSKVVLERAMLDVNKIHFILASGAAPDDLVAAVERACVERAAEFGLPGLDSFRKGNYHANRYDPVEVSYVKRMLQQALPEALRAQVTAELFARHVSADETAFAEGLYVSVEQLRLMVSAGMHVGSHGASHYWLSRLTPAEQEKDIAASLRLLAAVGTAPAYRSMCYPYGEFTEDTVAILARLDFKAAVTTRTALAEPGPATRFVLPRLDTNDLPKSAGADPCPWTLAAAHAVITDSSSGTLNAPS